MVGGGQIHGYWGVDRQVKSNLSQPGMLPTFYMLPRSVLCRPCNRHDLAFDVVAHCWVLGCAYLDLLHRLHCLLVGCQYPVAIQPVMHQHNCMAALQRTSRLLCWQHACGGVVAGPWLLCSAQHTAWQRMQHIDLASACCVANAHCRAQQEWLSYRASACCT